ncbi:hypothetical protein [Luteipulveratus mongoliensis]|nr:hypothetical protein [Luteipulveratus mongoliensis]
MKTALAALAVAGCLSLLALPASADGEQRPTPTTTTTHPPATTDVVCSNC